VRKVDTTVPVTKSTSETSWRDVVPIHPAAELFPRLSDAELVELGEDIRKTKRLRFAPVVQEGADRKTRLLDGISRLDAMERVGIRFEITETKRSLYLIILDEDIELPGDGFDYLHKDEDPYAYVASVNAHRRHLTAEKKRELIANLLKEKPARSNLAIAKLAKADDKTVATVRRELEANSEIPYKTERTEASGRKARGRKAGASNNKSKPAPVNDQPTDVETSAAARIAEAAAIEEQQLDNVAKNADFMLPSDPPPGPDACPGGEPAQVAMTALCWLVIAASPDLGGPHLAEHLATIAADQTPDPLPSSAVERVIGVLIDVSLALRAKEHPESKHAAGGQP
jgi:hypothetical protein